MKLKALRVREVGRFSQPVALEGFTGGLDVFVGDNEAGKSTLVKALKTIFSEKYSSKNQKTVGALVPYAGGAPLIEVDFEIAGQSLRLTKQFWSGTSARLFDLTAGQVIARNADAETALHKFLHGAGRGTSPLGLFWLDQQEPLSLKPVDKDDQSRLRDVIANQFSDVVVGGEALGVRRVIEDRLKLLVTKGGLVANANRKPLKNGDWDARLRERDAAQIDLNKFEARYAEAQERLRRLLDIERRIADLAAPAAATQRTDALAMAKKVLAGMQGARAKRQTAVAEHGAKLADLKNAETAHMKFVSQLDQLAKLEADLATATEELQRERQAAATASEKLKLLSEEHTSGQAELVVTRSVEETLRLEQNHAGDAKRHDEVAARIREIDALLKKAEQLEAELRDNQATPSRIVALERELLSIDQIEARLAAAAPEISVAYETTASDRVLFDGRTLAEGETFRIDQLAVLMIPGVGKISVKPGGSDDVVEDRRDLAAHREVAAEVLQKIAVSDPDDALKIGKLRADAERALSDTRVRLSALAPQGPEVLRDELGQLAEKVAAYKKAQNAVDSIKTAVAEQLPTLEAAAARVRALDGQQLDTAAALEKIRTEHAAAVARVARLEARSEELGNQQARLESELPDTAARDGLLQKLQDALVAARSSVAVADQQLKDLDEVAGSETTFVTAQAIFEKAEVQVRNVERELEQLRLDKKGLEGELTVAEQQGIGAHLQECRERLEHTEQRVQRVADEVAALAMLLDEMAAVEQQSRDRFLQPVMIGLQPYFDLVFPGACLRFSQDLSMAELTRNNQVEPFANISDGTREQLAILVRMGFGRVFANGGQPLPLVLDDPLAFSDDSRLGAMFQAFEVAAKAHQVVVLSCREQAFEALQGNRLTLTSWRPDAGA